MECSCSGSSFSEKSTKMSDYGRNLQHTFNSPLLNHAAWSALSRCQHCRSNPRRSTIQWSFQLATRNNLVHVSCPPHPDNTMSLQNPPANDCASRGVSGRPQSCVLTDHGLFVCRSDSFNWFGPRGPHHSAIRSFSVVIAQLITDSTIVVGGPGVPSEPCHPQSRSRNRRGVLP